MKCSKCHADNRDGVKFCEECGAKMESICPNCNAVIPHGKKFCGECGHDLRPAGKAAPINFDQPGSYTPKHLADKILTSRSAIEGERKLVTVLFADVANYTALSEKLDPEEVHQIMDGCFKILMDTIHKYEGTINQFTGDGLMALFGAPVSHEDHAQRACHAALLIQKAVKDFGEKIKMDTGADFRLRIGLNSGPVIVGSIGDDLRMDYTAVGDTTNLAARMQSLATPGGIFVSEHTNRLARDFFNFESLGSFAVKGKKEPQQVFELIKTGDVATRIGASVAKGLTRFVGRKNSMATLMEAFDKAKTGAGQVVALVGEAGVGKSRLLLELKNRLSPDETIYLEGRCLHFGGAMAYLPILDIIRCYFEIKEDDREFIIKKKIKDTLGRLNKQLDCILPMLYELLSLPADNDAFFRLEPKKKREKTFEALRDLVIRISQEKPLIFAVEDLHWIDRTCEEFLDYLIGWLSHAAIVLILLYRPEYTHQWAGKSYYTRIGLNQLGPASSSELIKAILEEGEAAPELAQLILERAAGNPLFMEEFTQTLLENGSIEKVNDHYALKRKPSDIQVPDTIQGIIAARMDRLEDNIKRTMQVASVIGRDFTFRILKTITGLHEELKSYLLNLQGLEFIYEKRLFPELEYIFKHALIQEVAYNSLLIKRRHEIHQKIAQAIESLYADRLEEFYEMLAFHYTKAENFEKACRYSKRSAGKAVKNYANQDAVGYYQDALNMLGRMPDNEETKNEQIEICMAIFSPIVLLGLPEGSIQIIKNGLKIADEIGDERKKAIFYDQLSVYYTFMGDPSLGKELAEKSFQKAVKLEMEDFLPRAATRLQLCLNYSGEYIRCADISSKVIPIIEKNKKESEFFGTPLNVYSALLSYWGLSLAGLGKFDEGETFFKKGLGFAITLDHLGTLGFVEWFYAMLFVFKGDGENALVHSKKALDFFKKGDAPLFLPWSLCTCGIAFFYLGEVEAARKHIQKALEIQADMGVPHLSSYIYMCMGMVHLDLKDFKAAENCVEEALRLSQTYGERAIEALSRAWLGRILVKNQSAEFDTAEANITKGIEILEELQLKPYYAQGYLFLGELHAAKGDADKAADTLKKAEKMFLEMGMKYWLTITQKVLKICGYNTLSEL